MKQNNDYVINLNHNTIRTYLPICMHVPQHIAPVWGLIMCTQLCIVFFPNQHSFVCRHFLLRVIDVILPKIVPEMKEKDFYRRLVTLRTANVVDAKI